MSRGLGKRELEILDLVRTGAVEYDGVLRWEFRKRPRAEQVSLQRAYRKLKAGGYLVLTKERKDGPFGLYFEPKRLSVVNFPAGGKIDNT